MKYLITIAAIFILAFAASALLEIDFFTARWPRYALVVLLIAAILVAGMFVLVQLAKDDKPKN